EHTHRAAVDEQFLDVENLEIEELEQRDERMHAERREVLVIDGIEFVLADELDHLRHLDDERPILVKEKRNSLDKGVEVVDVVKGVGSDDNPGRAVMLPDSPRGPGAEVLVDDLQTLIPRNACQVHGGFDAERPGPGAFGSLEKQAVIATYV